MLKSPNLDFLTQDSSVRMPNIVHIENCQNPEELNELLDKLDQGYRQIAPSLFSSDMFKLTYGHDTDVPTKFQFLQTFMLQQWRLLEEVQRLHMAAYRRFVQMIGLTMYPAKIFLELSEKLTQMSVKLSSMMTLFAPMFVSLDSLARERPQEKMTFETPVNKEKPMNNPPFNQTIQHYRNALCHALGTFHCLSDAPYHLFADMIASEDDKNRLFSILQEVYFYMALHETTKKVYYIEAPWKVDLFEVRGDKDENTQLQSQHLKHLHDNVPNVLEKLSSALETDDTIVRCHVERMAKQERNMIYWISFTIRGKDQPKDAAIDELRSIGSRT